MIEPMVEEEEEEQSGDEGIPLPSTNTVPKKPSKAVSKATMRLELSKRVKSSKSVLVITGDLLSQFNWTERALDDEENSADGGDDPPSPPSPRKQKHKKTRRR
jgi:hypothetical protein